MYDYLDNELLLLIVNSFHALTNINFKEGDSCLQKRGVGAVVRWGDNRGAEDLLPFYYAIYTLINHPTLNKNMNKIRGLRLLSNGAWQSFLCTII